MADCYLGETRMFAGLRAPQGWNFCDGTTLSISQYSALFSLIGTTYGGDGVSTFKLPDLRGRLPIGQGNGAGLTPRPIGQADGQESVTLATAEMPAHNHGFMASGNVATAITPSSSVALAAAVTGDVHYLTAAAQQAGNATAVDPGSGTLGNTGGNLPHDNMMPGLVINFIIALQGIYPQRS